MPVAEDSFKRLARIGKTLITDGGHRGWAFATRSIIDNLGGTGLASKLAADG